MAWITLEALTNCLDSVLEKLGMDPGHRADVVRVFLHNTTRRMKHHDIYDLPMHLAGLAEGKIFVNPVLKRLAAQGCQERWDGGNGMGPIACSHAMRRAVALAREYGMGLCAIRNSNHYISSAPYTALAADSQCIGLIIAKAGPSMGMPGYRGNIVSQSPNGFAFPTERAWPVALDGCLAYVSMHGNLNQAAAEGRKVPGWWGVDVHGNPTDDPARLLKGTRYPIGEHKGFGYAMLCETLTGVLSGGPVLDEPCGEDGAANPTSHTAIAIKTDALMSADEFRSRSEKLVDRIEARAPGIRIPGQSSGEKRAGALAAGGLEMDAALLDALNGWAERLGSPVKL